MVTQESDERICVFDAKPAAMSTRAYANGRRSVRIQMLYLAYLCCLIVKRKFFCAFVREFIDEVNSRKFVRGNSDETFYRLCSDYSRIGRSDESCSRGHAGIALMGRSHLGRFTSLDRSSRKRYIVDRCVQIYPYSCVAGQPSSRYTQRAEHAVSALNKPVERVKWTS